MIPEHDICGSIQILNFAVDKTIETSHTTSTDCNVNYRIILLVMFLITSWCKPLETDPFRAIGSCFS